MKLGWTRVRYLHAVFDQWWSKYMSLGPVDDPYWWRWRLEKSVCTVSLLPMHLIFEHLEENVFYFFCIHSCKRVDERGNLFLVRVYLVRKLPFLGHMVLTSWHRSEFSTCKWLFGALLSKGELDWLIWTWLDLFLLRCSNLGHIRFE